MNHKHFIKIIKSHFPNIHEEQITFLIDGWDHFVFVIDDKIAFRFPRTPEHGKKDEVETKFFEHFAPLSPIKIQNMKLFTDQETKIRYQLYDFIRGIRFTKEIAKTLPAQELSLIASDLGKFLTALHAFPVNRARELHMDEIVNPLDYVDYWEGFLKEIKKSMYRFFSSSEQKWIEKEFKEYIDNTRNHPFEVKVTHFDLLPEHILINPQTHKLAGIIDFSLRISDPAYDFSYFERYGKEFLETVIKNYPPANIDREFEIRRKFYASRLGFSFLSQAMVRQKEKVPEIIEQIHEYIKENNNLA